MMFAICKEMPGPSLDKRRGVWHAAEQLPCCMCFHSAAFYLLRTTTLLTTLAARALMRAAVLLLHRVQTYITLQGVRASAADTPRQSVDLWAGAEPCTVYWVEALGRDWKPHPSQCSGHSLTAPHMPGDDCVVFWYRWVTNEADSVAHK